MSCNRFNKVDIILYNERFENTYYIVYNKGYIAYTIYKISNILYNSECINLIAKK